MRITILYILGFALIMGVTCLCIWIGQLVQQGGTEREKRGWEKLGFIANIVIPILLFLVTFISCGK